MSCTTLLLPFRIDRYEKTITYNDAGQPVENWTFVETLSCDFTPARAEERLVGRVQNPVSYLIYLSGHATVANSNQFRDLRDGDGDDIEEGPFNIIGIRKYRGFSKIDHITCNIQKVLQ